MVKQRSYGLSGWMWQRITAAIMALYVVIAAARTGLSAPFTAASWKTFFAPSFFKLLTLFFILSLLYHAWLGAREILMDYVRNKKLGSALEILVTLAVAGYAFWAMLIVWNI
jgi:succinate dehydrogenase / fumarate reductase, membrane anchor subunit